MNLFDDGDAESIGKAKKLLVSNKLKTDLASIKAYFSIIVAALKEIQSANLELKRSLDLIDQIKVALKRTNKMELVNKFESISKRNPSNEGLKNLGNILYKNLCIENEEILKLNPSDIGYFKFGRTTSSDVERTFSIYNHIFSDRRKKFTFDNLKNI